MLRRLRCWWLRRCSNLDSTIALITGRIRITRTTVMIITIMMITGIMVATIGIIIGGKLM